MTIRYITSGNESRAKGLLGEGRHQLSILKNAMTFQNLKQLQRTVRFNDGTVILCSSCFGQDTVQVFVPPYMPVVKEAPVTSVEKREYGFSFKITRDDGTVIDETELNYLYIIGHGDDLGGFYRTGMPDDVGAAGVAWGYDKESSDAQYWTLTNGIWNYWNTDDPGFEFGFSYDTNTQIWTVPFYEWLVNKEEYSAGTINPEKDTFWCLFDCDDSIQTQMSINEAGYIYKTADWWDETNEFSANFYEVKVPMWKVVSSYSCAGSYLRRGQESLEEDPNTLVYDFVGGVAQAGSYLYFNGGTYEQKLNVKSSVPYQVAWGTRDSSTRTKRAVETWQVANYRTQWEECCLEPPDLDDCIGPIPEICCWMRDTPYSACNISNSGGGPFTLVANSINLTITDDPISEETDVAEFSGSVGGADHVATISGGGSEPEPSPICEAGLMVYYPGYWPICHDRGCENVGNAPFDYTHWYPGVYDCVTISVSYDY